MFFLKMLHFFYNMFLASQSIRRKWKWGKHEKHANILLHVIWIINFIMGTRNPIFVYVYYSLSAKKCIEDNLEFFFAIFDHFSKFCSSTFEKSWNMAKNKGIGLCNLGPKIWFRVVSDPPQKSLLPYLS